MNDISAAEVNSIPPIEQAKAELGRMLADHKQGIDAARNMSYLLNDPVENLGRYKLLSAGIKEHFGVNEHGYPNITSGLFQLGDEEDWPDHSISGFIVQEGPKKGEVKSAKGLLVTVSLQGTIFEFLVLDNGRSREFLDKKNNDQKIDLMRKYVNRHWSHPREHYGEVVRNPDYFAIVGENRAGQYHIEEMIPFTPQAVGN
jgi:hypothetical protein